MKPVLLAQWVFLLLAAVAVYLFASMAADAETRRACVPLCALRPNYAARNRTAPDFELRDLTGRPHRLSALRGKTVVLNFWTTTCQPCLEEMPSIAELARMVEHRSDIAVVTVATDAEKATVETALQTVLREPAPFPVLLDPELAIVGERYGTHLFPETWIIDPEGVIRARFDGARDWSRALLLNFIDSLHAGSTCPAEFQGGRPIDEAARGCDDLD